MTNRLLLFLLLIMVTLSSSMTFGQDLKAPEIFFKEKAFNAGDVVEGARIEHSYTVYNRGNTLLKIQKVRTG